MGWQPIETAPKDGTRILCYATGWVEPGFLRWKVNSRFNPPRSYFGDCVEDDDYELSEPGEGPTFWFPLPEIPTP